MAKCDEGYMCDVCGQDVAELTDSDLYLRYVIGLLDPEVLHTTKERHIRCNPSLAQYILADDFEPILVEGPFDKRQLDPAFVREQEQARHPRLASPQGSHRARHPDHRIPAPRSPRQNQKSRGRPKLMDRCFLAS